MYAFTTEEFWFSHEIVTLSDTKKRRITVILKQQSHTYANLSNSLLLSFVFAFLCRDAN